MNTLYYGDNLDVLRRYVADESVDLVYLDPPFKSNQDYNVLFAEQDGSRSAAQIKAFEDTWRWDQAAAAAYQEIVERGGRVSHQQNSGPDLETTVSGTVTERPLADGRASVHVNIHTTNALTWVTDISLSFPGTTIFGSSPSDVVSGATPALGECDLDLTFINSAPGAPLPNLVAAIVNLGPPPPDVEVVYVRFTGRATGALHAAFGVPEGTLGRFMTSQTGFDVTACTLGGPSKQVGPPATADCVAVETMFIQVLGH